MFFLIIALVMILGYLLTMAPRNSEEYERKQANRKKEK